jgi:hypothetical protein
MAEKVSRVVHPPVSPGRPDSPPVRRHSAASGRDVQHAVVINAAWAEGGPAHPDIGWCRQAFRALQPHSTGGVYMNFLHNDEGEARVRAAYGNRYERLTRIKARYDPQNIFCSNQNIPPVAAECPGPPGTPHAGAAAQRAATPNSKP